MISASEPHTSHDDGAWLQEIHFGCDIRAAGWHDAEYGAAWSRHVRIAQQARSNSPRRPVLAATDPLIPALLLSSRTAAVLLDKAGCRSIADRGRPRQRRWAASLSQTRSETPPSSIARGAWTRVPVVARAFFSTHRGVRTCEEALLLAPRTGNARGGAGGAILSAAGDGSASSMRR
jgi:hypothetical protein